MPDMTGTIRVFVNASALELPAGADVERAIFAYDPTLLPRIGTGSVYVTDGRGIELEPQVLLANGAILRVVKRARRGVDADP
jgi:hypothetical protein